MADEADDQNNRVSGRLFEKRFRTENQPRRTDGNTGVIHGGL